MRDIKKIMELYDDFFKVTPKETIRAIEDKIEGEIIEDVSLHDYKKSLSTYLFSMNESLKTETFCDNNDLQGDINILSVKQTSMSNVSFIDSFEELNEAA